MRIICKCGCGELAPSQRRWVPGHRDQWIENQRNKNRLVAQSEQPIRPVIQPEQQELKEPKKPTSKIVWIRKKFFSPFQKKKKLEIEQLIVDSPIELKNQQLPKWAIQKRKPFLFNPKKRAKLTQLVFCTRKPPYQEYMWADTDELIVSVGQKGFKMPEAIHGGIVFWDGDNDEPLLQKIDKDIAIREPTIDPKTGEVLGSEKQSAIKTGMVKNYYYMLGKLEGARQLFGELELIKLLQILCIVALIGVGYVVYNGLHNTDIVLNQILTNISKPTNP